MTPVFLVRRRAEEFNSLVEDTSAGQVPDSRLAECLELVAAVRDLPAVEPRPEFAASLREPLLAAADTLLLPSADTQRLTLPPRRTVRDRRIAAVVGGFAVVGATSSLAMAAQSALPGEMLCPLKRAMENADTGIRVSDEAKGASMLASATDRLAEIAALSRAGDLSDDTAATTLTALALVTSELLLADNGDQTAVEELRIFTADSMETLTQLEAVLPAAARDELLYAAQVLGQIDAAAGRACPGCRGGIEELPSFLLSSAGQVAEPALVVPAPVVTGKTPGKSSGGKSDNEPGKKGDQRPDSPLGGPALNPDVPDTGGGGTTNPLDALTNPLPGGTTSSGVGGGGIAGVPKIDDVIKDADQGLPEIP